MAVCRGRHGGVSPTPENRPQPPAHSPVGSDLPPCTESPLRSPSLTHTPSARQPPGPSALASHREVTASRQRGATSAAELAPPSQSPPLLPALSLRVAGQVHLQSRLRNWRGVPGGVPRACCTPAGEGGGSRSPSIYRAMGEHTATTAVCTDTGQAGSPVKTGLERSQGNGARSLSLATISNEVSSPEPPFRARALVPVRWPLMVLSWLLNSWRYLSREDWGTAHSASGGALRRKQREA